MPNNRQLLFIVFGVVVVLFIFMQFKNPYENFTGTIPTPAQSSSIPSDQPGATTANPMRSTAQPKDIEAAIEALKNYKLLATTIDPATTTLSPMDRVKAVHYKNTADLMINQLNTGLANPSRFTVSDISNIRKIVDELTTKLRSATPAAASPTASATPAPTAPIAPAPTAPTAPTPPTQLQKDIAYTKAVNSIPQPTVAAGPVGKITLGDLKGLLARINEEKAYLTRLRSTEPTMVARLGQLTKLAADLGDMISSVERGASKIEDIPITPDAAKAFLAGIKNPGPIPPLIVPHGTTPKSIKASPKVSEFPGVPFSNAQVQTLLEAAKNLKWSMDVRLEYDPAIAHRERMLERLEKIIKLLVNASISNTPLNKQSFNAMANELKQIQSGMLAQPPINKMALAPEGAMNRLSTNYSRVGSEAPRPDPMQLLAAQGAGLGTQAGRFPHGEISPDVYIRPGFAMNDDQIAHRASAASYETAAVGGPDYKKRSLDLCRQIKQAQLGDLQSFGCILNPDEVGPNYSWKGNYTMVCNRLGDSWGRNYPAQFGCPPYDPTAKFSYSS